jgi:signal transduction histidine kinase
MNHPFQAYNGGPSELRVVVPTESANNAPYTLEMAQILGLYLHRQRNILATLSSLLDSLFQVCDSSPRAQALKSQVTQQFEGLRRSHRSLEDFCKPPRRPSYVQLAACLKDLWRALAMPLSHNHIQMRLSVTGLAQSTEVPLRDFHSILLSLVLNAVEALGTVESDDRRLTIEADVAGEHLHLVVSDNGPGIPSHILDRIWSPNFSTHPDRARLGLAIVLSLVEGLGGQISVSTGSAELTRFAMKFPVQRKGESR